MAIMFSSFHYFGFPQCSPQVTLKAKGDEVFRGFMIQGRNKAANGDKRPYGRKT